MSLFTWYISKNDWHSLFHLPNPSKYVIIILAKQSEVRNDQQITKTIAKY